ncbi:hypothetical protein TrVE_jg431 [Triparma verrucosa]|uniref:Tyrosine-protein kinase ephrin type A/B receptor-like domain-containing protein n=1 Tax=Triparma verrucosa TaxID=1606542 RepID=A0A9W7BMA3_9STRA|nr:hypothetical protein TrVE_jg431 [Triparma verrucosa]
MATPPQLKPSTYSVGGNSSCLACSVKTYSDTAGATVCKFCPSGQVPSFDQQSCVSCDAGHYSNIGDTTCSQCVAGLYSPSAGSGVCSYCDPGTYSTLGSATCSSCPGGRVSSNGAASCSDCVAGKYDDGNNICQPCAAGTFSSAGSTSCDSDCPAGTFGRIGETSCSDCEAGKFAPLGADSCQLCEAGTYSGSGVGECTDCAIGTFSSMGADVCTPCEAGFHAPERSPGCSMCTSGKYSEDEAGECSVCSAGKMSGTGASSCAICAAGKYSQLVNENQGANHCTDCDAGKFSSAGSASCSGSCEAGTYGGIGSSICLDCSPVPCEAGTFSIGGSTECSHCEAGKYSGDQAVGCTAASTCGAGRFIKTPSTSTSNSECEDCAVGKASIGGQLSCSDCDSEGEYSDETGLPSCKTIPSGHKSTANHDGIIECPKNTFSLGATSVCSPCLEGGHSNPGSAACEKCETGKYFYEPSYECVVCAVGKASSGGSDSCDECTARTYSEGGFNDCKSCDENAFSEEGSISCAPCGQYMIFNGAKCVCDDTFITVDGKCTCAAGKTLSNRKCASCEDGHFKNHIGTGSCDICDSTVIRGAFESIDGAKKISSASCACGKGKFHDPRDPPIITPQGTCAECSDLNLPVGVKCDRVGLTLEMLVINDGVLGKERLSVAFLSNEIFKATATDNHWSKRYKTKAKILTSFYQIVSRLPYTLAIKFPDVYSAFSTAISSVFNLNIIGLINVGCLLPTSMYSFYGGFLVTALAPIVLSLLLLLVTLRQRRNLDPYAANKLTSERFGYFFGLAYLVFPGTTTTAFATFLCTTYGDDETYWLISDRSIDLPVSFAVR